MRVVPSSFLAAAIAAAALTTAADAAGPRAVLELFTSRGCPSCPPADELLTELAREPDLIALSLPVDYWDQPGTKDPFARSEFSLRQDGYASQRGENELYTPQVIVNGREPADGAERSEIEEAATATAASLRVPVNITRGASGIVVSVGAATGKAAVPATVVLLPYVAAREVPIGRGSRHTTYTNVVGEIRVLGGWSGGAVKQTVPAETLKGYDGVAVLLQQGSTEKPGAILGAARVTLR